jgi:predicted dehydrogenase
VAKSSPENKPLKFGILGAAAIAPDALITPAKSHPEVVVFAVAARSKDRATVFAKKHGIPKVFGGATGYQGALSARLSFYLYYNLPS